jgi:DNA-binding NarL/FixJ family response regulator
MPIQILLADDHVIVRQGLRSLLERAELTVMGEASEGQTAKEIASSLGLSVKTIESHRTRLMRKLDIHETAALVRYAIRRGLTSPCASFPLQVFSAPALRLFSPLTSRIHPMAGHRYISYIFDPS